MKKKGEVKVKVALEKGERRQTLAGRCLFLIQRRNDLTINKLAELTNMSVNRIGNALTKLRKAGIKVFPSKGWGSPLRIATSETEMAKYLGHRRNVYLPTMKRMIITEQEAGEKFAQLRNRPTELLQEINDTTSQII